jgi:hypothetical protein
MHIERFRWLISCIERETPTLKAWLEISAVSFSQCHQLMSELVGRMKNLPGPASTVDGGMLHVDLPPHAPAAWPTGPNGE